MSIGVPIKVLHEAEGHIVTCETNTGEVYRGKLIEAEDNMNCQVGPAQTRWIPLFVTGNMRLLQEVVLAKFMLTCLFIIIIILFKCLLYSSSAPFPAESEWSCLAKWRFYDSGLHNFGLIHFTSSHVCLL